MAVWDSWGLGWRQQAAGCSTLEPPPGAVRGLRKERRLPSQAVAGRRPGCEDMARDLLPLSGARSPALTGQVAEFQDRRTSQRQETAGRPWDSAHGQRGCRRGCQRG